MHQHHAEALLRHNRLLATRKCGHTPPALQAKRQRLALQPRLHTAAAIQGVTPVQERLAQDTPLAMQSKPARSVLDSTTPLPAVEGQLQPKKALGVSRTARPCTDACSTPPVGQRQAE